MALRGKAAHQRDQLGDGRNAVDFGQQRNKRSCTGLFDGALIHETCIEIGDLRGLAARLSGLQLGDDPSYGLFGLIAERDEGAGDWLVLRNLGIGQPMAIHVPKEIILDSNFRVEVVDIQGGASAHHISHSVDASPSTPSSVIVRRDDAGVTTI